MTRRIGIVVPSYNETFNIKILARKIFGFLPEAKVLIVDDSSQKENEKLKTMLKSYCNSGKIKIISRQKKSGRGSAVVTGLMELLKNKDIQYFFEMDADLAHDPKDFNKFLKVMESTKADVVFGSRYITGSKIVKWPLKRLILSKIYNILINIWLGLKLSDYTNGFRLYNRRAIKFLTRVNLREKGFITLSEIAYRLKNRKFKIVEVPISFTDRKYGKSNADFKEYTSALLGILRIKIYPMEYKKTFRE